MQGHVKKDDHWSTVVLSVRVFWRHASEIMSITRIYGRTERGIDLQDLNDYNEMVQ